MLSLAEHAMEKEMTHHVATTSAESQGTFTDASQGHNADAILSDASHVYRVCNTRPSRLLPTSFLRTPHSIGRLFLTHYLKNSLKFPKDNRRFSLSLFPLSFASCQYYVIALRHLLC